MPLPGGQKKYSQQFPSEAQTTKDGEEGPPETQKKKKHKVIKPPLKTALTDDDYELIATRTHDTLKDSFDVIQSSQEKIQSVVEQKLLDLKLITEKTAMI